jgi:glycosyltransferase involved in cell wall biosynthesis
MNKFRIGIWINEDALATAGGGYYYENKLVVAIDNFNYENLEFEIYFIGYKIPGKYKKPFVLLDRYKKTSVEKLPYIGHRITARRRAVHEKETFRKLESNGIKLIFYPKPGMELKNFPGILNNWDIGHRSMYAFPEVANERDYKSREDYFNEVIPRALFVCVESNAGKAELMKYYNVNEDRIKILPIFSGEVTDDSVIALKPVELDEKDEYLFYPAQFWAHKNHYNLVLAFRLLTKTNTNLKLVFTGSDKGNLGYLQDLVRSFQLENKIIFLNFRETAEIKWLYKNARALVMPSFLGPTNMPLIEASELNCLVVCSDLAGHREILKEQGIYFDPKDPADIADKISRLLSSGKKQISYNPEFTISHSLETLNMILTESISIRNCWE